MQSWRIHLGWAIVTVLAVAVTARIAAPRAPEPGPVADPVVRRSPEAPASGPEVARPAAVEMPPVSVPASAPKREPSTADKIWAFLRSDNWAEARKGVAALEPRDVKLSVFKEALGSSDQGVVTAAIYILRDMKGRDVAELLEAYLKSHLDETLSNQAAGGLGDIGDPGSIAPLRDALRSRNETVRIACADSLMTLGDSGPATEMIAEYTRGFENPDGSLRKTAVENLVLLRPELSIPLFTRALKDSNGEVRWAALDGFFTLGQKEHLPLVEPMLQDPNPEVVRKAEDVVRHLKDPGN